ncbi:MAG: class I SAM-dependent methyltransferase [bacterium]|nr:class I SAM-dependent methyltransferase [bacterium]
MRPTAPAEIYDQHYSQEYAALFIKHPYWASKLQFNVAALGRLLKPLGNWVDVCCGQGWHLAQFPHHQRTGIDLSTAQLDRARALNPGVHFVQADLADYEFPEEQRFDVVSSFWSSYSYLADEDAIRAVVEKLIRWTAPGGTLYLELTSPEMLGEFNQSEFAVDTGSKVTLQTPDGVRWLFEDPGGLHQLISPPVEFFSDLIEPHFATINHSVVIRTIRQLIAQHKRPD